MNYEAGTEEERKGLTKCLNFKRPETILRLQARHGLASVRREFIRTFFVYIAKMKAPSACRDPVQLRPKSIGSFPRAACGTSRLCIRLTWNQKGKYSVEMWSFDFSKHADVSTNAASRETARDAIIERLYNTLEDRAGYRRHVAVLLEVVEIFIICHQSYCVVTLLLLDLRRTERAALTAHCNANGTALIYLALEGRLLNELYHVPL